MDPGATADTQPMPPSPPVASAAQGSAAQGTAAQGSAAQFSAPRPEPPEPNQAWGTPRPKRVGQLSPGWRVLFGLGWVAIILGNVAVWESSRVIGLSTWWLGADAEPRMILINLLPFYGPLMVAAAAFSNWRYAPFLGIGVALLSAGIGAGDVNRVRWIAVVELVLAGAALCISVASLAGMYRPARDPAT